MNLADTPDRLCFYLDCWKQLMQSGSVGKGYPQRACGLSTGGVLGDFDEMVAEADWSVAHAVDAVIESLPPSQRAAVYRTQGICSVWQFKGRYTLEECAAAAHENIRDGLKRRQVWVD